MAAKKKPEKNKRASEAKDVPDHNPTRSPFPHPRNVEKYLSDTGEKMTIVEFGPPFLEPLVDSAARIMTAACEAPGILNIDLMWYFVLPWLENPQPEKDRFWKTFNQPAAEKQRKAGIWGVKNTNYIREQQILGLIDEFKVIVGIVSSQDNTATTPLMQNFCLDNEQRKLLIDEILKKLGCWVIASVLGDKEAPRRLHSLLRGGPVIEPQAGNQARKILEKFVIQLAAGWRLPTKKQLRLASGFGNNSEGKSASSREFRKLGLAGLPEG